MWFIHISILVQYAGDDPERIEIVNIYDNPLV